MHILIFNWRDINHPLAGGAEIATHKLAIGWIQEGHTVSQLSSSFPNAKRHEIIDGVEIIRGGNHYTVHVLSFLYFMKNFRKNIDIIVDEFHFIPFFTPLFTRKKVIAFVHETARELWFKNQPFPLSFLGFILEPLFFKFYKNIPFMTVSDSTKKDLVKFGIKEENIKVINCGIEIYRSGELKEKNPTIIFLGRFARDKGTEDAIIAFYHVLKKHADVKLWIVGREEEKGYMNKLKDVAKKYGVLGKIMFFGYVTEKNKFDLLKRAWILLHPSVKEGWGLTVIEAASQFTPTIAYNIAGLRDSIRDKETGILVNDRNPIKLANEIVYILENKIELKKLSNNAHKWSRRFTWQNAQEESISVIKSIL